MYRCTSCGYISREGSLVLGSQLTSQHKKTSSEGGIPIDLWLAGTFATEIPATNQHPHGPARLWFSPSISSAYLLFCKLPRLSLISILLVNFLILALHNTSRGVEGVPSTHLVHYLPSSCSNTKLTCTRAAPDWTGNRQQTYRLLS